MNVYILYVWKETQGISCIEKYPKETRSVTANVWEEYIIAGFRRPNDVVLIHMRLQLNTGPPSVVTSELWYTEEDEVADTERDNEGLDFLWLPSCINPLNPELNPICYLLALLGAHHFLHVSRIRVKLLALRWLMSYIYGAPILDVSRSHTTTQHSR